MLIYDSKLTLNQRVQGSRSLCAHHSTEKLWVLFNVLADPIFGVALPVN